MQPVEQCGERTPPIERDNLVLLPPPPLNVVAERADSPTEPSPPPLPPPLGQAAESGLEVQLHSPSQQQASVIEDPADYERIFDGLDDLLRKLEQARRPSQEQLPDQVSPTILLETSAQRSHALHFALLSATARLCAALRHWRQRALAGSLLRVGTLLGSRVKLHHWLAACKRRTRSAELKCAADRCILQRRWCEWHDRIPALAPLRLRHAQLMRLVTDFRLHNVLIQWRRASSTLAGPAARRAARRDKGRAVLASRTRRLGRALGMWYFSSLRSRRVRLGEYKAFLSDTRASLAIWTSQTLTRRRELDELARATSAFHRAVFTRWAAASMDRAHTERMGRKSASMARRRQLALMNERLKQWRARTFSTFSLSSPSLLMGRGRYAAPSYNMARAARRVRELERAVTIWRLQTAVWIPGEACLVLAADGTMMPCAAVRMDRSSIAVPCAPPVQSLILQSGRRPLHHATVRWLPGVPSPFSPSSPSRQQPRQPHPPTLSPQPTPLTRRLDFSECAGSAHISGATSARCSSSVTVAVRSWRRERLLARLASNVQQTAVSGSGFSGGLSGGDGSSLLSTFASRARGLILWRRRTDEIFQASTLMRTAASRLSSTRIRHALVCWTSRDEERRERRRRLATASVRALARPLQQLFRAAAARSAIMSAVARGQAMRQAAAQRSACRFWWRWSVRHAERAAAQREVEAKARREVALAEMEARMHGRAEALRAGVDHLPEGRPSPVSATMSPRSPAAASQLVSPPTTRAKYTTQRLLHGDSGGAPSATTPSAKAAPKTLTSPPTLASPPSLVSPSKSSPLSTVNEASEAAARLRSQRVASDWSRRRTLAGGFRLFTYNATESRSLAALESRANAFRFEVEHRRQATAVRSAFSSWFDDCELASELNSAGSRHESAGNHEERHDVAMEGAGGSGGKAVDVAVLVSEEVVMKDTEASPAEDDDEVLVEMQATTVSASNGMDAPLTAQPKVAGTMSEERAEAPADAIHLAAKEDSATKDDPRTKDDPATKEAETLRKLLQIAATLGDAREDEDHGSSSHTECGVMEGSSPSQSALPVVQPSSDGVLPSLSLLSPSAALFPPPMPKPPSSDQPSLEPSWLEQEQPSSTRRQELALLPQVLAEPDTFAQVDAPVVVARAGGSEVGGEVAAAAATQVLAVESPRAVSAPASGPIGGRGSATPSPVGSSGPSSASSSADPLGAAPTTVTVGIDREASEANESTGATAASVTAHKSAVGTPGSPGKQAEIVETANDGAMPPLMEPPQPTVANAKKPEEAAEVDGLKAELDVEGAEDDSPSPPPMASLASSALFGAFSSASLYSMGPQAAEAARKPVKGPRPVLMPRL